MGKHARRRRDAAWNPPGRGGDITALFALLLSLPLLLPLVARFSFVLFAIPLAMMIVAAPRCLAAARRRKPARAWRIFAWAAAASAVASAIGALSVISPGLAKPAFYVGTGSSLLLLAGVVVFAGASVPGASMERVADALLFDAFVIAVGGWFVAIPGFEHHNPILTFVFLIDLAALVVASVATLAASDRELRRTGWWMVLACAAVAIGDGSVALFDGAAPVVLSATCWSVGGAAVLGATSERLERKALVDAGGLWVRLRIALPLVAALSFPTIAFVLWREDRLTPAASIYFAIFFVVTLIVAFGRQAHLLLENDRAVARERELRREVVRRNEELEALTALATTMTETLEEDPVLERGLTALRLAARATSMALHARGELRATVGAWGSEAAWADRGPAAERESAVEIRGGRQIVRIALGARGEEIGLLTIVRAANDAATDEDLRLLELLATQVAIAVQNARDYSDRLEQAIRDPLTGLYNRRYFFEALEKEFQRTERYGSTASLVLLDVDDFKRVNDTLGHFAGDHVLREIARIASEVVRPADSFARVGGEEFALLLPETSQLDALLVAERLRRAVAQAAILPDRAVTLSAGISTTPEDATTLDQLESRADAALYWAKRNGKNLCAVATEVVVDEQCPDEDGMLAHLHALVAAIDAEHLKTRDHSENVAAYAVAIGHRLGLSPERMVRLRRAALLHDIGKIAVRASVLSKPAKLTDAEYEEMKLHSTVGAEMLRHSGFATEAAWVRAHHERIDGRGYPDGLAGNDIPLEARIVFVADSFEAMTSDRPYRAGMPVAEATAELRRCAGSQFDERVVTALCELLEHDELPVLALRDAAA